MRISVRQVGKPIKQIIIDEKVKIQKLRTSILNLGKKVHSHMLEFIAENTTTSKTISQPDAQPLVKTIDFTEYHDAAGFGWGIGDIDKLNAKSKHWYYINYGQSFTGKKEHPQAGKTIPGFFENTDIFLYAPDSGKFITIGIDTVIEPMDYIQDARDFLDIELRKIVNRYNRG